MDNEKLSEVKKDLKKYFLFIVVSLMSMFAIIMFYSMIILGFRVGFNVAKIGVMVVFDIIITYYFGRIYYVFYDMYLKEWGLDAEEERKKSEVVVRKTITKVVRSVVLGMCFIVPVFLVVGVFERIIMDSIPSEMIRSDIVMVATKMILTFNSVCVIIFGATWHIKFNPSYKLIGRVLRSVYILSIMYSMMLCVLNSFSIMNEAYVSYELAYKPLMCSILAGVVYIVGMFIFGQDKSNNQKQDIISNWFMEAVRQGER